MRVLVTGATGFLGNHVVRTLLYKGVSVVATARSGSLLQSMNWRGDVTRVPLDLDVLSGNVWEKLYCPTHCIHLAWPGLPNYKARAHIQHSLPQSKRFLFRLIDAGLSNLLVAGTCLEYGMQEGCLSEDMPTKPSSPYAVAKDTLRRDLEAYTQGSDCLIKWARVFYMYGKGQSSNSLFAQLEKALRAGDALFSMSGGEQVRDYLPVAKVAEYFVKVACHPKFSGVVNICSGVEKQLKDVVYEYLKERDASIQLAFGVYPYPDWEPFRFWGDNRKLNKMFGVLA